MSNFLTWAKNRGQAISNKTSILHAVHWAAQGALKSIGFEWELRRNGEVKLGYWRRKFRERNQRSSYPKRLVLLPGFGDTPLSWYGVMTLLYPYLRMNFDEVIIFDFPGYGGFLSKEKSFASIDQMMGILNDALDALKPHTIIGHSLGAWLTGHYAGLCGAKERPVANKLNYSGPESILLINPSGIFGTSKVKEDWENLFKQAIMSGFHVLRPHLFAKEPLWFRLTAPQFSRFITREDVIHFIKSFREDHGMIGAARQIRAKVWLIWGEKDTLIPPSCAAAWLEELQHSPSDHRHQAIILKGSGHSPHLEIPVVVAAVMGQILSGMTPHALGKRWWSVQTQERNPQEKAIS